MMKNYCDYFPAAIKHLLCSSPKEYHYCDFFDQALVFYPESISPCCIGVDVPPPQMPFSGGELSIDTYQAWLRELNQLNQTSEGPCRGCRYLRLMEGKKEIESQFRTVTLGNYHPCNAKCSFCSCWKVDPKTKQYYSLTKPVVQMIEKGMMHKEAIFTWSGGEPTILDEFPALAQYIAAKGFKQSILSSGIKFSPELAELLTLGNTTLQVSLDSGTPETYLKFKGRDVFYRILENLERYASNSVAKKNITLKYIMCNETCEDNDIEGFIALCKKLKIQNVSLSPEIYESKDNKTFPSTIEQMVKFTSLLTLDGLSITILYELFQEKYIQLFKSGMVKSINRLQQVAKIS